MKASVVVGGVAALVVSAAVGVALAAPRLPASGRVAASGRALVNELQAADTFARGNTLDIAGSTFTTGGNTWSTSGANLFGISGQQLTGPSDSTYASVAYATVASPTQVSRVQLTIATQPGYDGSGHLFFGVIARGTSLNGNPQGYMCQLAAVGAAAEMQLKRLNGVSGNLPFLNGGSTLASGSTGDGVSGDTIAIVVKGSTITCTDTASNGTVRDTLTATDSTYSGSSFNQVGVFGANDNGSGRYANFQVYQGWARGGLGANGRSISTLGSVSLDPRIAPVYAEQVHGNCTDPNVAYWESFDEASGNLTVPTGCGAAGATMTAAGSPTYSVSGAPNGLNSAITFASATSDHFTSSDFTTGDLTAGAPMVVEFWAKYTVAGSPMIVGKTNAAATLGWNVSNNGPVLTLQVGDGTHTCSVNSPTNPSNDGRWHYFRFTWDGVSVCTANQDNATATSATVSVTGTTSTPAVHLGIGYKSANGANLWDGSLADLRITIGNNLNNLGFNPGSSVGSLTVPQAHGSCSNANVALYESFDETSGNLTVPVGCAAAGATLTKNGSPAYSFAAPPGLGTAIGFTNANGSTPTDYFVAGTSSVADVPPGNSFVVEAWVKHPVGTFATPFILSKGYDSCSANCGAWGLYLANALGRPTFELFQEYNGSNISDCLARDSTHVVNDNNWHYLRATWNAGTQTCSIAVDGNTAVSSTPSGAGGTTIASVSNATAFRIGASETSFVFQGELADLQITVGNSTNNLSINFSPNLSIPITFTRATASTRYNGTTGHVETVASGTPVIGSPLQSSGALPSGAAPQGEYVDKARAFVLLNNQTTTGWTTAACGATTASSTDFLDPAGGNKAYKIVQTACGSAALFTQSISGLTANLTNTETAWLCGLNGGEVVQLNNGTVASVTLAQCPRWQRFASTQTFSDGLTTETIGFSSDGSHNGTIYLYNPEYLNGVSFTPQLDPVTTGSSVTVNADAITYPVMVSTAGVTLMGWYWSASSGASSLLQSMAELSGGAGTTLEFNENDSNNKLSFGKGGVGQTEFGASPSGTAWHHLAWTFNTGAVSAYVDGSASGSTASTTYTTGTSTTLRIGQRTAVDSNAGFVTGVRYYSVALTASQIAAIYAAQSASYAISEADPPLWSRPRLMLAAVLPDVLVDLVADALDVPTPGEAHRRAQVVVASDPVLAHPAFCIDRDGVGHRSGP